ncbi:hypothetical protein CsSME_00023681 [Camellia sinensis var. sinensis]
MHVVVSTFYDEEQDIEEEDNNDELEAEEEEEEEEEVKNGDTIEEIELGLLSHIQQTQQIDYLDSDPSPSPSLIGSLCLSRSLPHRRHLQSLDLLILKIPPLWILVWRFDF